MPFLTRKLNYRKWVVLLGLLILLYWAWYSFPIKDWSLQFTKYVDEQGAMGVFIFCLIYVVAAIFLLPSALLTFAAGVAYGYWGLPLVTISTVLGSCLVFFIARYYGRSRVEKLMSRRPQTQALKEAVEEDGWRFMFLLRISPFIPFNLNNYFLATLRVRFFTYLWVAGVSSLPGSILYVYLGTLGKDFSEAQPMKWVLFFIGLVATYILTKMTLKKTKQILSEKSAGSQELA